MDAFCIESNAKCLPIGVCGNVGGHRPDNATAVVGRGQQEAAVLAVDRTGDLVVMPHCVETPVRLLGLQQRGKATMRPAI